jgi:hypothetical protein
MSQLIKLSCHIKAATTHLYSSEIQLIEAGKRAFVETGVSVEASTLRLLGAFPLQKLVYTCQLSRSIIRIMAQSES